MKSNYSYLQNMPFKKNLLINLILIVTFIIAVAAFKIYAFDSFFTYAVFSEDTLQVDIPIRNSDAVKEALFKVSDEKYPVKIVSVGSLSEINKINYQTYILEFKDKSLKEGEVVEITFYYNKQRIIEKIMDIIF